MEIVHTVLKVNCRRPHHFKKSISYPFTSELGVLVDTFS